MSEQGILELEQHLLAGNEAVAKYTLSTAEVIWRLSVAETRNKKLKRSSRRGELSVSRIFVSSVSFREGRAILPLRNNLEPLLPVLFGHHVPGV